MYNFIQHFTKNTKGHDYVVGDIHGMFKRLNQYLENIGFDFKHDRLFSVGDLCDRGAGSPDIIEWLKHPWFFPVMGNHEQFLLDYFAGKYSDRDLIGMGGEWWFSLDEKSQQSIIKSYHNLPIAIDVETDTGLVGIIHAHCPHADWNQLGNLFNGMHKYDMIDTALWSQKSTFHKDIIKNVKAVIVGHMTQAEYIINGNVHLIDTGAVYQGGRFTILDLDTLCEMREFD